MQLAITSGVLADNGQMQGDLIKNYQWALN